MSTTPTRRDPAYALTEPVFRQIRRVLPPISGFDLSPIVVIILIEFFKYTIRWMSIRYGY